MLDIKYSVLSSEFSDLELDPADLHDIELLDLVALSESGGRELTVCLRERTTSHSLSLTGLVEIGEMLNYSFAGQSGESFCLREQRGATRSSWSASTSFSAFLTSSSFR